MVESERVRRGISVIAWAEIVGLSPIYYQSIRHGRKPWNPTEATERSIREAMNLPSPRFRLHCKMCGGEVGDYCTEQASGSQAPTPREGCPYWEIVDGMIQRKKEDA